MNGWQHTHPQGSDQVLLATGHGEGDLQPQLQLVCPSARAWHNLPAQCQLSGAE